MKNNPGMQRLVKELADDCVKEELMKMGLVDDKGQPKGKAKMVDRDNGMRSPQYSRGENSNVLLPKPKLLTKHRIYSDDKGQDKNIKSPSDTTLYAPALKKES